MMKEVEWENGCQEVVICKEIVNILNILYAEQYVNSVYYISPDLKLVLFFFIFLV